MRAARSLLSVLATLALGACAQAPLGMPATAPASAPSDRPATAAPSGAEATAPVASAPAPVFVPPPAASSPAAMPDPVVPRPAASLPLPPPAATSAASPGIVLEPGLYRCELSRQVTVRRVAADGQSVVINWNKRDFTLTAVMSRAGALRYDDIVSGLAWITIPGKSMLLDTKKGAQLANECKL